MTTNIKKRLTIASLIFACLFFLAGNAAAQILPLLDFVGNFYYCDGKRRGEAWCTVHGSPRNSEPLNYSLEVYIAALTGINYLDGSFESDPANDPVLNAWIEIGTLYNDGYPDHYIFGNTQPSGGTTGPVIFKITDGPHTYLTATLDFVVIEEFFALSLLNSGFNTGNIYNVIFNESAPYSRYIEELKLIDEPYNFSTSFTFYTYSSDFTSDAFGSVSGKLVTGDRIDNDDDGYPYIVDCNDNNPDINPGMGEDCTNGIDDNCNDLDDGNDPECDGGGGSSAEICDDRIDNDNDGKIDCADKKDCRKDPVCS